MDRSVEIRCVMDALNDDELIEIFRKLPTKTVHTLKSVCKHWSSLISNPNFVFSYLQSPPSCKSTYLILHINYLGENLVGRIIPLDKSSSVLNRTTPLSLDFLPLPRKPDNMLVSVTLAATCNWLSLFKADWFPPDPPDFYICNLITRQWSQLPSPTLDRRYDSVEGFTCQTSIDSINGYKVLGITVVLLEELVGDPFLDGSSTDHQAQSFRVRVFSTKVGSWKTYNVPLPDGFEQCRYCRGKPEVINGIFHWDAERCIVAYDPLNNPYQCEVIKLPDGMEGIFKIATSEGKLRVLKRYYKDAFCMWELVDYDNRTWTLRYKVEDGVALRGFHMARFFGDRVCLLKTESGRNSETFLLDLRDGSVTKLAEEQAWRVEYVMPYEIDSWPTPVPQLGVY